MYHIALSHHVSLLRLLWSVTVSQTSHVFYDFGSFESTGEEFCRLFLNLGLSEVFLVIRQGLWVLRKNTLEMKCLPHHILSGDVMLT